MRSILKCSLILILLIIHLSFEGQLNGKDRRLKTSITGTIVDDYYISPDRSIRVKVPVTGSMGGRVSDKLMGPEDILVAFLDDLGNFYLISSVMGGKSCGQISEEVRQLPNFVKEETVTTERGEQTWQQVFLKEGSPLVTRQLTGKTVDDRKPKKLDLYLTRTCLPIGSRTFIVGAGVTAHALDKKSDLLTASKNRLKKFLDGLTISSPVGKNKPTAVSKWADLGKACYSKGQYDKAKEYFKKDLDEKMKTHGDKHPEVAISLVSLGLAWSGLGKHETAIHYYEKALAIDSEIYGDPHPALARDYINLGVAWSSLGKYEKAIHCYEKALSIDSRLYGENHPGVARYYIHLGLAWKALDECNKAVHYHEKALSILQKAYGDKHPQVARTLLLLGDDWNALSQYKKAVGYYEKALLIYETALGSSHGLTKRVRESLDKARGKIKN